MGISTLCIVAPPEGPVKMLSVSWSDGLVGGKKPHRGIAYAWGRML